MALPGNTSVGWADAHGKNSSGVSSEKSESQFQRVIRWFGGYVAIWGLIRMILAGFWRGFLRCQVFLFANEYHGLLLFSNHPFERCLIVQRVVDALKASKLSAIHRSNFAIKSRRSSPCILGKCKFYPLPLPLNKQKAVAFKKLLLRSRKDSKLVSFLWGVLLDLA